MSFLKQKTGHFPYQNSKIHKNKERYTHSIYKNYYICLQIVSASVEKGINNHEKAFTQQTNTLKPNW